MVRRELATEAEVALPNGALGDLEARWSGPAPSIPIPGAGPFSCELDAGHHSSALSRPVLASDLISLTIAQMSSTGIIRTATVQLTIFR